jgi:hypothetical protein
MPFYSGLFLRAFSYI